MANEQLTSVIQYHAFSHQGFIVGFKSQSACKLQLKCLEKILSRIERISHGNASLTPSQIVKRKEWQKKENEKMKPFHQKNGELDPAIWELTSLPQSFSVANLSLSKDILLCLKNIIEYSKDSLIYFTIDFYKGREINYFNCEALKNEENIQQIPKYFMKFIPF